MRQLYSTQIAIITGILIILLVIGFAVMQSPEILEFPETSPVVRAGVMPHAVQGYERCNACHGIDGIKPYPIRHLGWDNKSCIKCHLPYNNRL